jgi:hypothetical protein
MENPMKAINMTMLTSRYPPQAGTGAVAVLAIRSITVEMANKMKKAAM